MYQIVAYDTSEMDHCQMRSDVAGRREVSVGEETASWRAKCALESKVSVGEQSERWRAK